MNGILLVRSIHRLSNDITFDLQNFPNFQEQTNEKVSKLLQRSLLKYVISFHLINMRRFFYFWYRWFSRQQRLSPQHSSVFRHWVYIIDYWPLTACYKQNLWCKSSQVLSYTCSRVSDTMRFFLPNDDFQFCVRCSKISKSNWSTKVEKNILFSPSLLSTYGGLN